MTTALLESVKGENDSRNYFMINLNENHVAGTGSELATSYGLSEVRT